MTKLSIKEVGGIVMGAIVATATVFLVVIEPMKADIHGIDRRLASVEGQLLRMSKNTNPSAEPAVDKVEIPDSRVIVIPK